MSETIVKEFLESMLKSLQQAKDFGAEQIPIVAQEIIRYNMTKSFLGVILGVLGGCASYRIAKKGYSYSDSRDEDRVIPYLFLSFILGFASFILMTCNTGTALETALAPRVFLIEYVTHEIRSLK